MIKNNFDDLHYPENIKEILEKNVDEKMITHIKRANADYLDTVSQKLFGIDITYRETFANIEKYAKALKGYGIEKGDCVTLAMPNIPETIYYIYACNAIGAIAYPIDPRSTLKNMIDCIKNSKSKLFICEMTTYYGKVAKYINSVPVDNIVVVSPLVTLDGVKIKNSKLLSAKYLMELKKFYEDLKLIGNDSSKKYTQDEFVKFGKNIVGNYESEYNPDIPAIIVNTSGTTGNSIKGAMHSNRNYNYYANEAQFVTDQLVRGNSYYGYVPYCAMYGSGVGMHVALSYGIVIDNVPKFNGQKAIDEIVDRKISIVVGIPNLLEKVTEKYVKEDLDASHVKQYIIGGDNVTPAKLKEQDDLLMARGMVKKMVYGYGATECMPVSTMNQDPKTHLYGSTGIVYPETYVKIIDVDTNQELDYNQEGEIYVHNQTLMLGYLNNPSETNTVLVEIDGKKYYKTGDKGYLSEDGFLYLTGRYKRMMKRPDGHQTSPIPLENAINQNPYVNNCAVVGITRRNGSPGVLPTAFVVLNDKVLSDFPSKRDAIQYIAEDSFQKIGGERECVLAYVEVESIPMTINGKVDFIKLSENKFDDMHFYAIDDLMTKEYLEGLTNLEIIKIDKGKSRSLNIK